MRTPTGLPTLIVLSLLPVLTAGQATAQQEADRRPGVAVLPFTNGGSYGDEAQDLEPLEVGLQQLLLTELAQHEGLRIVERSVLREIIDEQDLGTSGRVAPGTAARLGELVGARYVLTGVFIDVYGNFHMDTRVVDVETGEILATQRVRDARENLYDVVLETAEQFTAEVDLPPLPAQVRDARRQREIPEEAITLYSRAQVLQDAGRSEQAAQVYRRIVADFPQMTEAREALEQIDSGAL